MNDQDKNQDTPEAANEAETTENETAEEAVSENGDADGAEAPASGDDAEMTPEEEVADLKDKLLRTLADMENLRRRSQKDREDALKYSSANFARDMLSVADNLRRAIESIPEEGDPDGAALVGFIEGIALTEKELLSTLERHGIQKIDPMGEKFDPQFHEAMFEIPSADEENGTVLQVVEVGYVIHDRLLRPAKVGIAKAGPTPTGPGDQVDTTA
ncbi:MAG: nucleotide exchange factor GrpE [Alphaproteobacteria bacterium]